MANGRGIMGFALNMLANNPNIANNPQAKQWMQVIQSGDAQQGQQIADNICRSYGLSREDAIMQAKRFFNLPG